MLKAEDVDSNETASFAFSLGEVKDVYLGWDDMLRRWEDTRACIRHLGITFQDETESQTLYTYTKRPEAKIYAGENESIQKNASEIIGVSGMVKFSPATPSNL